MYATAVPVQAQAGPLPPGWEQKRAPDGRTYFVNHLTQTTSWTRPAAPPPPPPRPAPAVASGLPPGWEQKTAPDGRTYFVCHASKTTSWTRPAAPPPPPPPRPAPAANNGLPPGWEQKQAPDGRTYYVDHATKTTHWTKPVPTLSTGAPQVVGATVVAGAPQVVSAHVVAGPPGGGGPIMPSGTRRALLIGCNYPGTSCALRGCVNDTLRMRELLLRQGFPDAGIRLLRDDKRGAGGQLPTKANIIQGLRWLVGGARRGDAFFFHFSGHGSQERDTTGDEADGYDETIVPCDYKRAGQITDDVLFQLVVKDLPEGCKLTSIMDCCHSGTGLDLPYNYVAGRGWQCEEVPFHTRGDVQMFSGCEDDQTSADTVANYQAGGAMTNAFLQALAENPMPLYTDFMDALHRNLRKKGFKQRPQLSSTQRFGLRDRVFHLTEGFVPNHNTTYGVPPGAKRTHANRRRRGRRPGGGLETALAAGMGIAVLGSLFGP